MSKKKEQNSSADAALYQARDRVIHQMPTIIDAIIKKALDGSYQHAKFLLDFAGSEPAEQSRGQQDESLASMLMKELREGQPPENV